MGIFSAFKLTQSKNSREKGIANLKSKKYSSMLIVMLNSHRKHV